MTQNHYSLCCDYLKQGYSTENPGGVVTSRPPQSRFRPLHINIFLKCFQQKVLTYSPQNTVTRFWKDTYFFHLLPARSSIERPQLFAVCLFYSALPLALLRNKIKPFGFRESVACVWHLLFNQIKQGCVDIHLWLIMRVSIWPVKRCSI